ncbi:MAG: DUF502 domain-containing protein [Candidatus Omnitrophica bacterium]|nr:DUF502 domain-containing protein [Candidatus Omnitrophota bacterium]
MRHIWNKFIVNFVNGIVILLPITITVLLVRFILVNVNNAMLDPIFKIFYPLLKGPEYYHLVKIIIFFTVIFLIVFIGWGAKILFINRVFSVFEGIFIKLPFLGKIYNAAKQIFSSFIGQGRTIFKEVVLVEFPRKGLYSVGFTTGVARGEIAKITGETGIHVFMPTTPNPTTGVFIIVPKGDIIFLNMSVEEGMKLVISGGAVGDSAKSEKMP